MEIKKTFAYVIAAIALSTFSLVSCKKNSESTSTTSTVNTSTVDKPSFQTHILPIFQKNCQSCHGESGAAKGFQVYNYATISANASKALSAIKKGSMPPNGKLSDADIGTLQNWINQGTQNN